MTLTFQASTDNRCGWPMLVVNMASRRSFTYQYDALQKLFDADRSRGLVVIGVPSNDFHQELATAAAVESFCEVKFNIDFPMTDIVSVRGSRAHPFYAWAANTLGSELAPQWTFHKYLIGPDGARVTATITQGSPDPWPRLRYDLRLG